jgi:hypothetical protein
MGPILHSPSKNTPWKSEPAGPRLRVARRAAPIYRIDVISGRRGECYNGDSNRIGGVFSGNRRHFFDTADSESSK